jgi:hypothetical protein
MKLTAIKEQILFIQNVQRELLSAMCTEDLDLRQSHIEYAASSLHKIADDLTMHKG